MRVVTLCNGRVIPLMQRTLPGWISCGLSPVVYGSPAACKAAEDLGAESHLLECGAGGDSGTESFFSFVERKIDVWEHSLELDDTLFLDLDIEVFSDLRGDIPDDCDIYAQDDDGATRKGRPMVCTGATWFRRCDAVASLLRDARAILRSRNTCDEFALNIALASSCVRTRFAPHDEWQTVSRGPRTERTKLLHHNGPRHMTLEKKLASLSLPRVDPILTGEPAPDSEGK